MPNVAEIRRLWEQNTPDEELARAWDEHLHYAGFDDAEAKLAMSAPGGLLDLSVDILRDSAGRVPQTVRACWTFISNLVPLIDVEDERENVPIDRFCELGGIELMARELERRITEENDMDLLLTFAWLATNERAIPGIVDSGVHKRAIRYIEADNQDYPDVVDTALSFLRTVAVHVPTRQKLRDDGALQAVVPHLEGLKHTEPHQIRRGYRAGSIVARLAGNDETGVGPQILRGNPLLVSVSVDILDKTIDAGPKVPVMNMMINPKFITMDLLVIAVSDANKPLLKGAIPVLIKALKLRGVGNEQMVNDIVKIFLQLTYEKECLRILQSNKLEIRAFIDEHIREPDYDVEARLSAQNLLNALEPPVPIVSGLSQPVGKPRLFGIVRRAAKESKEAAPVRRRSSASAKKHVMLSYNWGVKPIVRQVDDILRANGLKTWIDERDMGPNLNDSMASAIENAFVVFVFMTTAYKESANCRKECEYADGYQVPIVYIMAQENYHPNGWLGIQLGKAVWIPCWSLEKVSESEAQLIQRARTHSSGASSATVVASSSSSTSKAPVPSSSSTSKSNNNEVLDLLKSMQAQLSSLEARVGSLEQELAKVRQQQKQ